MTIYTEILTITVPIELSDIASLIARALDPDIGGDKSFHIDEGGDTISMTTRCTHEFKEMALVLIRSPQGLHSLVKRDYEKRWSDIEAPSLEDIERFCSAVIAVN